MAVLELDTITDGTPHYSFRQQLEGVDYLFTFRFGERRGGWVFDLATLDGSNILLGQLVTCGRDFLVRVSNPDKPPGQLWALNVLAPAEGGELALPGLYDLGAGAQARLYYTESTTLADNTALAETS